MRIQAVVPDRFAYRPRQAAAPEAPAGAPAGEAEPSSEAGPTAAEPPAEPRGPGDLDDKQKAQLLRLQQRDAEVRAHEAAHAAAAGMLGGGASYDYVTGPDGRQYVVGGEVPVRISAGGSPEEAIRNAAQVRAAALAPAEPSGQDRAVAAQAAAIEAAARAELAEARRVEFAPAADPANAGSSSSPSSSSSSSPASSSSSSRPVDPDETTRQLEAERRSTRGSWRHMHLASGCGNCSAAAARYV